MTVPTPAQVPTPPSPSLPTPSSVPALPEWVLHPDLPGRIEGLLTALPSLAATHLPVVGAVVGVLLAAAVRILLLRRAARRRWYAQAHLITVLPPASLDAPAAIHGAGRAWRDLLGIARPWWTRLLRGQPHLATEIWVLPSREPLLRVWVPGTIPPGRVENALRAAWPGCLVLDDADTPASDNPDAAEQDPQHTEATGTGRGEADPMRGLARAATVTAGRVVPWRAEYLPLRVPAPREDDDPLRTLEALAERLDAGESAVVQILARPAVGSRLRRFRTRVDHVHQGRPAHSGLLISLVTGLVRALLDLLTPGEDTASSRVVARRVADPQRSEELRAIREKGNAPLWEVTLRYAVTSRATGARARQRVRGIAGTLAGAFEVLSGRNSLRRRRLRHPEKVLPARRLRRASVWSVPELATLAHVPVRTRDLAGRLARGIPAPDAVTHTDDP